MNKIKHPSGIIAHLASFLILLLLTIVGIGISIWIYRRASWTPLGALGVGIALALAIISIAGGWGPWVGWIAGFAKFTGRVVLRREYGVEATELGLLVKHNQALVRSVGEKSTQLGELRFELKTAKEKEWRLRLDGIRDSINAGYSYSQREEIQRLVLEVQEQTSSSRLDRRLMAQIYRVAAIAYLPGNPGGDSQRCKRYLARAEKLAEEDETLNLQIIKALVALNERGTDQALKELRGYQDAESARLRLSLLLELNRIDEAQHFIENEPKIDEWMSPGSTWHAAIATFYAFKGENQLALDHLGKYLSGEETADRHRIAGGILFKASHAERERIVREHDLFPEFAIALELDDLVDRELARQAASELFKAGQLFENQQCTIDAEDAYSSVSFILFDLDEGSELLRRVLTRLEALDPEAPAVFVAKYVYDMLDSSLAKARLDEVRDLFQRFDLPDHLKLSVLEAFTSSYGYQREAISILRTQLSEFKGNPSAHTHCALLLVRLLKEIDDIDAATEVVDEFEKSTPRPHLACILRSYVYHETDDAKSAEIAGACLEKYPDHLEVLATAAISWGRAGKLGLHVSVAQKLFEVVKSQQTFGLYISALWESKQYTAITDLLRAEKKAKLPDPDYHRWLARALIASGGDNDALEHLNWLRDKEFATLQELITLAQILLLVMDKPIEARNVLADAIARYPDYPEPYMLISRLYMLDGNRVQAFSWARKARDRFPDDANVAANLWILSFPTGYEDHHVTEAAWADISPGGRLYTGDFIRPAPFSQLLDWFKTRSRVQAELEKAYYNGRLSLPLLCYFQGFQVFDVHKAALLAGQSRYVSRGDKVSNDVILGDEVVLELTSFLSLWALFEDGLLEELASSYTVVWIPTSLRQLLINEQNEILTGGQRARYESQVRIRDLIESNGTKFIVHDFPGGGSQGTGQYLSELAQDLGVVVLQEFSPPEEPPPLLCVGIADILGILKREGLLTPEKFIKESHGKKPPLDPTSEEIVRVTDSWNIVADLSTLTEFAVSGIAKLLVDQMQEIHIAENDKRILLSEIARFERRQQIKHELQQLRDTLRLGEEQGVFRFASAPLSERFLGKDLESRQGDIGTLPEAVRTYTTYLDDLLWIINDKGVALWSDDLWTRQLSTEQRKIPQSFSTDAYLNCRAITNHDLADQVSTDYLSRISELLAWGYQVIPVYPEFVKWRLGDPPGLFSTSARKELERFRAGLVSLFKRAQESGDEAQGLAQVSLSFYQDSIVRLMWDLFERGYDLSVCSEVFSELDLASHAEAAEGWEFAFYSSFFTHSTMTILELLGRQSSDRISQFHSWIWDMFVSAGVQQEALEYAWLELLQRLLDLIETSTNTEEEKIAKVLLGRYVINMPYQAWDYLARTDVGMQLEHDFQVSKPGVLLKFEAATQTQPMVAMIDQKQWETDIETAFDHWLADPNKKMVVHGSVAIYPHLVESGVPFVQVELVPTDFLPERSVIRGEFRSVGLLHGIMSDDPNLRRFVYDQGLEAIVSAGVDPAEWQDFAERGLLDESEPDQEICVEAHDYLLGNLDVFRRILMAAVRLGRSSVFYVLQNLSPDAVRRWLDLPPIDSTSGDEWILSIEKRILEKVSTVYLDSEASDQSKAAYLFDRYGRSFLIGVAAFISSFWSELETLDDNVLRSRSLETIIEAVSESGSRVHRAVGIAFLIHLLSDKDPLDRSDDWSAVSLKSYHLLEELLDSANYEESKTNMIALEQVLASWLYERWKGIDHDAAEENPSALLYLSAFASSIIIDVVASAGNSSLIDLLTEQLVEHTLGSRLMNREIEDRIGLYHPSFAPLIDYPVLFLVAYLSKQGIDLNVDNTDKSLIIKGMAERLSAIRMGMTWVGLAETGSAVDGILTSNIVSLCERLELTTSSRYVSDWREKDIARLNICTTPTLASQSLKGLIKAMDSISTEEQKAVLRQMAVGITLHSASWQDYLSELYKPEVLASIIENDESHKDLLELSAQLWLWRDVLNMDLISKVEGLLFSLPGDWCFVHHSLHDQGRVLALILHWVTDLGNVGEWLKAIAQTEDLDNGNKRALFREFIFDDVCRSKLHANWEAILNDENLGKFWEFQWLRRLVEDPEVGFYGLSIPPQ